MMLQDFIYKLELGVGYRYLRLGLGCLALVALVIWYDAAAFKNFSTQEAMDAAQLARNIASGHGYTTLFIRPASVHLVHRWATKKLAHLGPARTGQAQPPPGAEQTRLVNLMHLGEPHPDLANPPVYPLLLAGVLRLLPYDYSALASGRNFSVYKPDLWITLFNQALFAAAVVMVFGLARRLFEEPVAWVSAAVLVGAEVFWRFSISGLSTILLVVIFLGLVWVLAKLDPPARDGSRGQGWLISLAVVAGILVGLGGLTRYAFGWLIIPVAVFLATLPGQRRAMLAVWAVAAFLVVMAPWIARNYSVSGTPFGTAGFAMVQNTAQFPHDEWERTLNPEPIRLSGRVFVRKLLHSGRDMLQNELPKFGGSWVSAFFLASLLTPFRNPTLGRLRWFLLLSLALFLGVQALGRTGLTAESPEINSENLLVVFAPVGFIYGVSLFFILLDQPALRFPAVRYGVIGLFCLLTSAPLVGALLAPTSAIAYPPYYPPSIQDKARWLGKTELWMSDIPWAVAWYGRRQCVWLSLKYKTQPSDKFKNDFFAVNDEVKPVKALYLSAKTLETVRSQALWDWGHLREITPADGRKGDQTGSVWQWVRGQSPEDWNNFILRGILMRQLPVAFPLKAAPWGVVPEWFLTESGRVGAKRNPAP